MSIFTGIQHQGNILQNNSLQVKNAWIFEIKSYSLWLWIYVFLFLDLMTVYQSNQFNLGGYKAKHMLYTLDKVSFYNKQDGWQQHRWELVTRDNQVPPLLAAPWALAVSWTEYRLGRAWDSRRCPPWRWAAQGWRCAARRMGRAKPPPHEHSWKEYCRERKRHTVNHLAFTKSHMLF